MRGAAISSAALREKASASLGLGLPSAIASNLRTLATSGESVLAAWRSVMRPCWQDGVTAGGNGQRHGRRPALGSVLLGLVGVTRRVDRLGLGLGLGRRLDRARRNRADDPPGDAFDLGQWRQPLDPPAAVLEHGGVVRLELLDRLRPVVPGPVDER